MSRLIGTLVIAALLLVLVSATLSADTNLHTHCDATGVHCEPDCDPDTGFRAQAEDDPCWLVQSPNSDYHIPTLAFGAKDYRKD